jgi:2-polyprenyl-3-methyl-5-hydroxy-6-metoxy-1,4-benzoquinol methylase
LAKKFEKIMTSWETRRRRGDVPVSSEVWEAQYSGEKWNFLETISELGRYSVIAGYIAHLKPQATVLDIGCGEGILFDRYQGQGYSKYLGVDISQVAIARLVDRQNEKTHFVSADAENFEPPEAFDAIVFNESIYYFHDPLTCVKRYCNYLKPNGLIILSTCHTSTRARSITHKIKETYSILDEVDVIHHQSSLSWTCTVLQP